MRKVFFYLITAMVACTALNAQAQEARIPEASSTQTIIQNFGLGKITLTYSRPNAKGRKIFGGLQPYGEVWRTGANAATTIAFSENVIIEGNKVPAGEYGLFTIPGPDEWTIIINKTPKQWGAYTYKQADDLLRFKVKAKKTEEKLETFTMQFANVTIKSADLRILWDNALVAFHLNTDDDAKITANIDKLMQGDKKPYFNAIQYYYENNKDLKKALAWAEEAEKTNPGPWYKLWKSRLLLKMGDKAGAIAAAQEGIKIAKSHNDDEYVRLNEVALVQAQK